MKSRMKKILSWLKIHSKWLKFLFIASVLLFVINQMTHILQGMTWEELEAVLATQKKQTLLWMSLAGLIAVLPMLVYDWVTVEVLEEHQKPHLPRNELFKSAWTTNTINNLAGFGGVIGATLRAKFYGKGANNKKLIATVSKVALFLISGLSVLCLLTFLDVFLIRSANPYRRYWVWLLGGGMYTPLLIIMTQIKGQTLFKDFPLKRVLKLVLGSFGQWVGALSVFLLIGKGLDVPVNLLEVYPLFVASTFIGMISMVPGGMGTFDVLMILGLNQVGVGKSVALAWLLYYRIFYYVIPFLTGIGAFIHQTSAKINEFFNGLPKILSQRLAHFVLVCMVYFAGIMMVLLSTVPNLSTMSTLFRKLLPFSFDFLDQTLNMMMGFLLLGLARGVANRVKKAYLPTIIVLTFCLFNTITHTVSIKLLIFYVILIGAVYLSRNEFYRTQLVFSLESLTFDGILYGVLFVLYTIVGYYASSKIEHGSAPAKFLLFPSEDVWIAGLAGLILAAITILVLYEYLGIETYPGISYDKSRVDHMLVTYPNTHLSHFGKLENKRHYFYQNKNEDKVMFTFEIKGNKAFVLGDPIGKLNLFKEATEAFYHHADEQGFQLVFYSITDKYALLLHDLGYSFIKIGEEGCVPLANLQKDLAYLKGKEQRKELLEEQGYRFILHAPPHRPGLTEEVKEVLRHSLQNQEEFLFLLDERFGQTYLDKHTIGAVYNREGQFKACILMYPMSNEMVGYDMICHDGTLPKELDTYIIDQVMSTYYQQGYTLFNLGLVPFSQVGNASEAVLKERLINTIYEYSSPLESFKCLYQFKQQFHPTWFKRYLAYGSHNRFIFLFWQLYRIINRQRNRTMRPVEAVIEEEKG